MDTVISAFADSAAAERAAQRLVDAGFAADHVHVHRRGVAPRNAAGLEIDEYATGGFFSNMWNLLEGLLSTAEPPEHAHSYDDLVRQESAGVSVRVASDVEAQRAEVVLTDAGSINVSRESSGQTPQPT